MATAHLAIDLGASSGRAIVGVLDDTRQHLQTAEVHRFQHVSCPTPTGPVWDLTGIWLEVLTGLRRAGEWCNEHSLSLTTVGVDTWGVDYVLLSNNGELITLPHCYRDPRNEAACERALQKLGGFDFFYERTGIQRLAFNTLFQLSAMQEAEPALLAVADRLLFLPDLFHFWLSGEIANELTIASTSGMLNAQTGDWDSELLGTLELPTSILGEIVPPGTCLGNLLPSIAADTGTSAATKVVTPASHDTASAIAAVPAKGAAPWAYLSSGTWSLLGMELPHPLLTDEARSVPFTHERGVGNSIRFLKNISGLWIVQELRREFVNAGCKLTFEELTLAAAQHGPTHAKFDVNAACLQAPGNMSQKVRGLVNSAGPTDLDSKAALVRCTLENLATSYATTLNQLEAVVGCEIDTLHIIGGGSKNELLNQLTADATGKRIVVGPAEATAIGNLLVQASGCGLIESLAELRQIVAKLEYAATARSE